MGLLLCLLAFVSTAYFSRRSLGQGVSALLAWGFFYGILRANYLDRFSHFIFDTSVIGLYLVHFTSAISAETRSRSRRAVFWLKVLASVPLVLAILPLQHPLVQFVGLRAAIFFLPLVVVGARLRADDLRVVAWSLAGLNVIAFCFASGEWMLGIQRFYPLNAATEILYRSGDVLYTEGGLELVAYRLPATFPNAHAYGGTMLATLPFLLGLFNAPDLVRRQRLVLAGVMGLTILGVFLCGARSPVILLVLFGAFALVAGVVRWRHRLQLALLAIAVAFVVQGHDRLQRFMTLRDVEFVQDRVRGSVNSTLAEVVIDYPLGAGLARAAGTSIPYFLQADALPQIGLENEYARIAVELGLPGLAIWLAFLGAAVLRGNSRVRDEWQRGRMLMRFYVAACWGTAVLGTGMLTSIPQTSLLLIQMGILLAVLGPVRSPVASLRRSFVLGQGGPLGREAAR